MPTDVYLGDHNWEAYKRKQESVGYQYDHRFNDDWSFTQKARFMHITAYQENTYSTGLAADGRTLGRRMYMTDESMDSFNIDNQIAGKFDTAFLRHNVLLGFDYQWQNNKTEYQDAVAPSIDIFDRDNSEINRGNIAWDPSLATNVRYSMHQNGYYWQDSIDLDKLTILAGGRYDQYENAPTACNTVPILTKPSARVSTPNAMARCTTLITVFLRMLPTPKALSL